MPSRGRPQADPPGDGKAGSGCPRANHAVMEYAARQAEVAAPQGFLQRVFAWMFGGLLVTAAAAAAIGASDSPVTDITENPILLIVLFGAQIGLVIWLTAGIQRMSPGLAAAVFFAYA